MTEHRMTAILPCKDLATSQAFYARLGFRVLSDHGDYVLLTDGKGADLHLRKAEHGFGPEQNPFGLYFYVADVDALATEFAAERIGDVGDKPWGMYEFAMSDPDEALVRVGRPSVAREGARM